MYKNLENKLKYVPNKPGVYQFVNTRGEIIYIGKAKELKKRVRSYFQKCKNKTPKTFAMIKHINNIEWIVVRNEVEALLTEANLIKKHKPRYNVDLRDDKSYPFIRITNEPFPQVFITRNIIKDGSKYYGPFTDSSRLRIILKALNKVFPIRSCSYHIDEDTIIEKKISVCLDYHIKKCEGPCEGLVTEIKYNNMIERIEQFFKGKTKEIENCLNETMINASKHQRYEEASLYRDQLEAINLFKKTQSQVATDFTERDVITLERDGTIGIAVVLRIRNGRIFSRDKLYLKQLRDDDDIIMKTVIMRFYMHSDFIPQEISLEYLPIDSQGLIKWLSIKRGGSLRFIYPKIGEKAKELRVAKQNSKLLLGEWLIERKKKRFQVPKMLDTLKKDLNMDVAPRRIEAFDISHLGGNDTVASLVFFLDGKPKKSSYRRYDIKSVSGIDDFAAIREVITRRYKRVKNEKSPLPDLILIDGGKGQLSMAISALRDLGMDYIPIIGLAKRLEEVYIPGNSEPQNINKASPGLILLKRIRDEAHRFAIKFQREKRKKNITGSFLENVKGLGKKRIEKLYQEFKSLDEILNVQPELISARTKIPLKTSTEIIKIVKERKSLN